MNRGNFSFGPTTYTAIKVYTFSLNVHCPGVKLEWIDTDQKLIDFDTVPCCWGPARRARRQTLQRETVGLYAAQGNESLGLPRTGGGLKIGCCTCRG